MIRILSKTPFQQQSAPNLDWEFMDGQVKLLINATEQSRVNSKHFKSGKIPPFLLFICTQVLDEYNLASPIWIPVN
ncbi:hypothetical protein RIR_jg15358.t1 [Rhizophagus irregularis DAOM 181602=DAOM 197198]|nr:hypothetical protein RIR_jg15358.t1 [Rhizophagus irregularis DAOM 181602=DAOM 197198]CAB4382688.1 unnamed protein product [Rhizophagus irregularis]CAB5371816.1 unnamed protein product [Rhizophagus irregularis]